MFAYIQCRLNLFVIRTKRTNRKLQSMFEIRLKVDISQLHIRASITSKRTMTIRYIYDLPIRKSSTYLWDLNFKNFYLEKYFWTDFSWKEALFSLDHGNSFQMRQIK